MPAKSTIALPLLPGFRLNVLLSKVLRSTLYAGWKRRLRPGGTPAGTEQARTAVAPRPGSLRRNVMALLQTPDKFWGWYRPAVRAGAELIKKESIDVILSSGPPWTSHLVARRLRKTYGVPWIADFRDAWVSNTWRQDLPRWRNSIDYRFEASCISRADLILCTTDALRESFLRNYPCLPSDKFAALTNGFDDPTILPKKRQLTSWEAGPPASRRFVCRAASRYFLPGSS